MPPQTYFLVSLPASIAESDQPSDALTTLRSAVTTDNATTYPFSIPTFKIGTLEGLVQQADELSKLEQSSRGVVEKVADSLRSLLEGDEDKIREQKVVNDKPVSTYLTSFAWSKTKYRSDNRPVSELIQTLQKELNSIDNDTKSKFTQYNTASQSLTQLQRSQTGNLSQKSLTSIVNPEWLLKPDASEYITQHLVAVPIQQGKEFLKTYEGLSEWVVPRSATLLAKDDEFFLYAVTVFKKQSTEFVHKCRERRWTPRDWKFHEGGKEAEDEELRKLEKEERKLWGEALRMGRTGYGDAVVAWMHVLALRVFVESVLRYGLPANFATGILKLEPKRGKKAKQLLDAKFSDLGGNAMNRDKKGKPIKDDSSTQTEMAGAGMGGGNESFEPYVFYEFEIA
nr:hypothetical protein B0A51_16991 [Rachicladosporium sp. CCFEE 5018]